VKALKITMIELSKRDTEKLFEYGEKRGLVEIFEVYPTAPTCVGSYPHFTCPVNLSVG